MKFLIWLKSLFSRSKPHRSTNPLTKARQQVRKDAPETGAYANVAEVLAALDEKFMQLRTTKFPKFRGAVLEADLIKRVGAYIPCSKAKAGASELDGYIAQTLPSFFLTSFPTDDDTLDRDERSVVHDWLYILKLNRQDAARSNVEVTKRNEVIYLLGVGLPAWKKYPSLWQTFAFFGVDSDGKSRELRYKETWTIGRGKRRRRASRWRLSPVYESNERLKAHEAFTLIANFASLRDWHWCISVRKDDYKIVFTIPDNDAPRFFKAREGKRNTRIFHSVIPHPRTLPSGKVVPVKFHYRGRRAFTWNGYEINIHVPGKHRGMVADFTPEASIEPITKRRLTK